MNSDIKSKCEELAEECINAAELIAEEYGTLPAKQERPDLFLSAAILRAVPDLVKAINLAVEYLDDDGLSEKYWTEKYKAARGKMSSAISTILTVIDGTEAPETPSPRKVSVKALYHAFWTKAFIDEYGNLCGEDEALEAVAKVCGCEPEEK